MNNIRQKIRKAVQRKLLKKAVSFLVKKLLLLLAPLIPVLLILLLAIIFAVTLFAAFYGSMPQEQTLTGVKVNDQDQKIYTKAEKLVQEKNVEQTWLNGTHLAFWRTTTVQMSS
ncbi:hypothetical protein P378_00120 [Desulforamulus profundi]|uniref:Uncharacterized protein n=2 Tax=Desulforamulus profundi TaxID=1383067 RepID=A0A2C6LMW9_9FIRM|nr:hypothetical protein P378_00120 [Desulforamulus profundi]